MKKKSKFMKVFLALLTFSYIFCIGLLVVESALPGGISADQSNTVGGGIADIINQGKGDQFKEVKPTSISFTPEENIHINVDETKKLEYQIEPEDTTYTSVEFSSDDPSVVSVDAKGTITGISAGTTKVNIHVQNMENINSSIQITVDNVYPQKITSEIAELKKQNDVYELTAGQSYQITTEFEPINTTDKSLTYTVIGPKNDEYFTLNNSGTITALKSTNQNVFTIIITTSNNITSKINFKIKSNEIQVVPLEKMEFENNNPYLLSLHESIRIINSNEFKLKFIPQNATYQTYEIISSNPSVVQVSDKTITGIKEGESTLRFQSLQDSNIYAEKRVIVQFVELNSFTATIQNTTNPILYLNSSEKITINQFNPTNASLICLGPTEYLKYIQWNDIPSQQYENEYFKIDKDLTITPLAPVTDYRLKISLPKDQSLSAYVHSDLIITITDTDPNSLKLENYLGTKLKNQNVAEYYISTFNQSYKLTDYIQLKPSNSNTPLNVTYELVVDSKYQNYLSLIDNILIFNNENIEEIFTFSILINYQNIVKKSISYLGIVPFTLQEEESVQATNLATNSSYQIYVNESAKFQINSTLNINYDYQFFSKNYCFEMINESNDSFILRGVDEGEVSVSITPELNSVPIEDFAQSFTITILHHYVHDFDIILKTKSNNAILEKGSDGNYHIIQGNEVSMSYEFKGISPTKYTFDVSLNQKASDVNYQNNTFSFNKVGIYSYTITETFTHLQKAITFSVEHFTKLNEAEPYTITQPKGSIEFDENKNEFKIENGIAGKFEINFTEDSTYQIVSYSSSDNQIATIGKDGVITPVKVGRTTLKAEINNGYGFNQTIEININVIPQKFIRETQDFFYLIRKGLGHFGAFLLFAICSVLFFTLCVKKQYWYYSIPFAFTQGFLVAALTEFIQLFVPGRGGCFSDVIIDYTGFAIGGGITVLITLIITLISYIKKKHIEKAEK